MAIRTMNRARQLVVLKSRNNLPLVCSATSMVKINGEINAQNKV